MSGLTDFFKLLSGGVQAYGAYRGVQNAYESAKVSEIKSDAQKMANEAQATVADNNSQLAIWQSQDALYRGSVTENATRLSTAALKSTQRARMAANGIALDEGSALNVLADTEFLGGIDAMTARDNAAREAWAYKQQAIDHSNKASLLRAATVPIAESPTNAALGSILSGAGKVASLWYDRK